MAIFQVTSLQENKTALNRAVESSLDEKDRYALSSGAGWLISFEGTSVELSHLLGITSLDRSEKSKVGSALVVPIDGYYGRGSSEMWEWLKVKFEQS